MQKLHSEDLSNSTLLLVEVTVFQVLSNRSRISQVQSALDPPDLLVLFAASGGSCNRCKVGGIELYMRKCRL